MNTKIFKSLIGGGLFAMAAFSVNAQQKPIIFGQEVHSVTPEGKIRCAATEYNKYVFENFAADAIQEESPTQYRNVANTNQVLTMPVVVHVIHNGQSVGVGPNIADGQVFSQITVLNQDFSKMAGTPGYNTDPVGANTEVQFCLAQTDPNGNLTNGINRVNLGATSWNTETQIRNQIQAVVQWDPTRYYNIYVVNFGGSMNGTLGYATYPFQTGLPGLYPGPGSPIDDGFVVGYKYFGSRALYPSGTYESGYDRGRTSTHEMGHALGLIHIWGDAYNCTTDDYCPDTPMQYEENYYCSANVSCGTQDMFRNYMDYTPDTCMNIFTENQKSRIRQALQNGTRRATLLTSGVCSPPASTESYDLGMVSLDPNPTHDVLNIFVPDNYDFSGDITIYNTVGQQVYTGKTAETSLFSIDVSGYTQGVYFVKINKGSQTKTLQFIKK